MIQGLLREQWGFNGLIVTDDLNMGAVHGYGIGRAAGQALAAGADMILVSYDPDQYYRAIHGARQFRTEGALPPGRLAESDRRLAHHWREKAAQEAEGEGSARNLTRPRPPASISS